MEIISQTEAQRHEHRVDLTKIYLHILFGRRLKNQLQEHKHTVPSLTAVLAKDPRTYLDMRQVIHTLTLPDGTEVTTVRPEEVDDDIIGQLAEWLCSPLEIDADIDLSERFDDMPDVDVDAQRLSQVNAMRIAMAITGAAPTGYATNPAAKFNEELKNSLVYEHDHERLNPKSRLGRMTNEEYALEREIVTKLDELWPDQISATASEVARHITERFGTRFHLTWPPKGLATDATMASTRKTMSDTAYATGLIYASDLAVFDDNHNVVSISESAHALDPYVARIYIDNKAHFARDSRHFTIAANGALFDSSGQIPFVTMRLTRRPLGLEIVVTDDFYKYLVSLPSWKPLASGIFEAELVRILSKDDYMPEEVMRQMDDDVNDFFDALDGDLT